MTVFDAVTAVTLLNTSIDSNAGFNFEMSSDPLHTTFPVDPTSDYLQNAKKILTGLLINDNLSQYGSRKEWIRIFERQTINEMTINKNETLKQLCGQLYHTSLCPLFFMCRVLNKKYSS